MPPFINKRFALLGASLLGALLGGSTIQASTAALVEDVAASVRGPAYTLGPFTARKSAPAPPTAQVVGPRQMAVRAREVGSADFSRFVERPGRRRVKYGRHRWVILG